jgi:hypothetical protein
MADFGDFGSKVAQHNVTLPGLADGAFTSLQTDSEGRLLVSASGQSLDVSATDLDIRDLSHTQDSVALGDGTETVNVTTNGELEVYIPSGVNVAVDLAHTDDSVAIGDGTDLLDINADGSINITDNGGSITVDGTFWQATQPISGSVSVSNFPGTQTVDNAGTFAVQEDGAALTALQLIDDAVHAEDAAQAGGDKGMAAMVVRDDALSTLGVADGDYTNLRVNDQGELYITGTLNATVDDMLESGTEADTVTDGAGDGLESITSAAWVDLATLSVPGGTTAYLTGLDASADVNSAFRIITDDNGTPAEVHRIFSCDPGLAHNASWLRAIEVTGAANRSVILQGRATADSGLAGGAINAYTR